MKKTAQTIHVSEVKLEGAGAIRYGINAHVLWAEIHRPQAHNAINFEVMAGLETVLDRLEADESLRVFVLSGSGEDAFAAGGDLKQFAVLKTAEDAKSMARRMLSILERLEKLPCWTVACLNGNTYGGGWETMLAFDFRIAAPTARFGFTQLKFYLLPGWGGLTRLIECVGRSRALEWLAEEATVDAATALQAGLINRIASDDAVKQEAWRWAQHLSKNDRAAINALKIGALNARELPRTKAIAAELAPFSGFWADAEHHRRVADFFGLA